MIEAGQLEKLEDYELDGKKVLASRLGYRITAKFVHNFFGRVFDNPTAVFTEEILKPEIQDAAVFADGVNNIVEAQQRVAEAYFTDGTIEDACPPLKALLHIMARGHYQGKDAHHPDIRALFSPKALLTSDWYQSDLRSSRGGTWRSGSVTLGASPSFWPERAIAKRRSGLALRSGLSTPRPELERVSAPDYLKSLMGTIGADPIHRQCRPTWCLGRMNR